MVSPDLDAETQAKVLRQVEFYFSDSNLPGDKFLLKCIEEGDDGLVSLPLVCSFSRMRSHLGLKDHGPENVTPELTVAVAAVLRQSTALRLSEDGTKVGRLAKLKSPDEVQAEVNARSIAANPLPYNITLDEVETFFKEHSKVNSVRLPRHPGGKAFCGHATIELASEEEAQRVLGLKLEFKGAELEFEPKTAFDARQATAEVNFQKSGHEKRGGKTGRPSESAEDIENAYPKGVLVAIIVKKIAKEGEDNSAKTTLEGGEKVAEKPEDTNGEKPEEETNGVKPEEAISEKLEVETNGEKPEEEANGEKHKDEKAGEDGVDGSKVAMDIDAETQVAREDIKSVLDKFGKINFVDFSRGDVSGYIRFEKAEAVQRARASAVLAPEGGFIIKDHLLTLNAVEGVEEKDYWKKLREGQGKRRESGGRGFNDRGRGRGGRFGRGRGGGGRGKGRWNDRNEERAFNGGARGKHKRFDDDEDDSPGTKSARTDS